MNTRQLKRALRILVDGPYATGLPVKYRQQVVELQEKCRCWLEQPSVQGIGFGAQISDLEVRNNQVVRVYVDEKVPKSRLNDPVPDSIVLPGFANPVSIDVIEIGRLKPHSLQGRNRPAFPGVATANIGRNGGSLGMFVTRQSDPGVLYVLSNHHVLGPHPANPDLRVVQQSADLGGDIATHHFADHVQSVPFVHSRDGFPNIADAAIARLRPRIGAKVELPIIGRVKDLSGVIRSGMSVQLFGNTSQHTAGLVTDANYEMKLEYPSASGGSKRVGFRRQVLCTPYTRAGDSGSAVVNRAGKLVGLHVAGSSQSSVFSRAVPLFRELGIKPASPADARNHAPQGRARSELSERLQRRLRELGDLHNVFGGVSWRLLPHGLEVDGTVAHTPGALETVPRVWRLYGRHIAAAAREFDVPVELIVATICTESGGKPSAVRQEPGYQSDASTPNRVSVGLTQTLISTARETLSRNSINRAWLKVPNNSIRAGTSYIAQQARSTQLDPPKVACAYNAGSLRQNRGIDNRWKLRQFPIGTGKHADRFVLWFNDCFRMFTSGVTTPSVSYFRYLN